MPHDNTEFTITLVVSIFASSLAAATTVVQSRVQLPIASNDPNAVVIRKITAERKAPQS